ncbi:winged helix-turn-helix domain-containing protein [Aquincola sp. S2]|uniref:Winged helix-turn-helix domain-containing protein n=1 Tax=Pseudaquabacterium terrae TaxID=2732868 RepID=A0ABX2EGN3_9BURK|nr:winged helix-turn-helix domain-containing protein [Aquabacterium terrae]NRF67761.1 winged helix-turn-helix domain-containing protein [Aquabacterium terrae]
MGERYEFEGFVLERSQQRVLRADGSELSLTPRHFAALLLFVENAGVLLEKDTLMRALWPGLVVEDNNLNQTVSGLRRALGEEPPGSRFIQTVARRGFRFIAPVQVFDDAEAPSLRSLPPTTASPTPSAETTTPTQPPGAHDTDRRRWLRRAAAGGVVAGVGAVGALGWVWQRRPVPEAGPAAARATLAVLPFKPLTADSRDELLEIGMADSLITRLSIVPGLVVRSVGSVRRYAGAEQDPVRAAQELDVDWIVDGSLQRRADQLRVSARLLRASDGAAAWSDRFDEKFTGVFDVQDLISARVMQALAARLQASAGVAAGLPQTNLGGTRDTDAYQLYLAASWHTQPRRADGLRKSIALFKQALVVDPGYALAHVGLAQAHRETLLGADASPAGVVGPVRQALQRALALAPNLAEALAEQGFSRYYFDFDWAGAEREFRRALAANPNVAMAHYGLAQLLLNQDRPDEGFVHLRLARELDPMSPFLNTIEASYLSASGRQVEARARLQRAFDIAPDFYLAHRTQAVLHRVDQRLDLAIASLRRAVAQADGNSRPAALLGMFLARAGQRDEARAILNQMLERDRTGFVPPVSLAVLHAALGETALALDALDKALAIRDPQLVFLKDDSRWSGLRHEPRFAALLMTLQLDRFGPGLAPS